MTTPDVDAVQPGLRVGPTSEFSLFFRVKDGQGPSLRAALLELQNTPGYRPGDYNVAISTIHEARFVLFDDDTRLVFVTSFDGPWDAYMEDFFTSGPTLALFDVIFRHVEGYDGLPDLAAVKAFVLGAEQTAAAYARNYGGTVKEIRKAQRVNAAFQQVLDHPQAAEALQHPALQPLLGRGRRLAARPRQDAVMSDHISGPRALSDPIADITDVYAFPSPESPERLVLVLNTLPMAKPTDLFSAGLLYRFRLRPLTRPAGDASGWAFVPGDEEVVLDCVFDPPEHVSDPATGQSGHEQHGSCVTPGGERVSFRVNDEAGWRGARHADLRRRPVGPVHHGRPRRPGHDRDPEARVHRPRVDLPRRQERAEPRRRARHRISCPAGSSSVSSPRP